MLSPDRLRVIHRGRDQLVEIDVLDVEGLAHMGAARAQQLRHLRADRPPVELGLHRIRRRRHLTERQRGGEDLDEERFHRAVAEARVERRDSPSIEVSGTKWLFAVPGSLLAANIVAVAVRTLRALDRQRLPIDRTQAFTPETSC